MNEKAKELFNGITNIDDELIESALAATPKSVKTEKLTALAKKPWFKWASAAAVFCVIIAGALVALNAYGVFTPASEQIQSGASSGDDIGSVDLILGDSTYVNGVHSVRYRLLSADDLHRFEPLLKEGLPRGFESLLTYWIKEEDLGDQIGVVTGSELGIAGQTVYHFALLPELDTLCIIKYDGKYRFFVGDIVNKDLTTVENILVGCKTEYYEDVICRIAVYDGENVGYTAPLFMTEDAALIEEIYNLVKEGKMVENFADLPAERQELLKAPVELCWICFYFKSGFYAQFAFYPSAGVLANPFFYPLTLENAQRLYEIIYP